MKRGSSKIGKRLAFGFGALMLLLIVIATTAYLGMQSLSVKTEAMLHGDAKIAEHAARARANTLGLRRFEKDIFLNMGAKAKQEDYLKKWNEQRENLLSRLNDIEKTATLDQDKNLVDGMRKQLAVYEAGMKKTYEKILAEEIKTPQEGNAEIDKYKAAVHHVENTAKDFAEEANKRLAATESTLKGTFTRAGWIIGILSAVTILFGIICSIIISGGITRPLKRAAGELTEGSGQVDAAAGKVSTASQSLADGASEQAASVEETSSSLEEMSSMTRQNADNSAMADKLMKESRQMVERANGSMRELTVSMDDITRASEETSKIIKTIDEIAFQTNLLALNAAVEAARAGEAGAGFAVVANEVRNLAMRAADAARNTSSLIESTVNKVKGGSELVQRTNEAFSEVSKSAAKVADLVSEIAAASSEQAQGIDQVNKAVTEMDNVIQQNAASAEESASAAEELSAQAGQMKKIAVDLRSLVGGGANSDSGGESTAETKQPKDLLTKVLSLKSYTGRGSAGSATGTAKGARPKDVIPLDEGDFKNF